VKAVRIVASVFLVLIGSASLAAGSVLWWTDGQVFDTNQVSLTTKEVFRDPEVQALLSQEITKKVMAYVGKEELRPQITNLVDQLVANEQALTQMDDGVRQAHILLIDGNSPTVQLNLKGLADEVRAQLVVAAPELDATLPPTDTWFEFKLLERDDLPKTYEWIERFHSSAPALLVLGACLIALALVLGPGRWALMMVAGLGVAGFGLLIVVALRAALRAAENRVTDPVARTASKDIFQVFFRELNKQSVTLIVVGGIVALLGVSVGLIRPEYMREKDPWSSEPRNRRR
jgi:hypothetical protein